MAKHVLRKTRKHTAVKDTNKSRLRYSRTIQLPITSIAAFGLIFSLTFPPASSASAEEFTDYSSFASSQDDLQQLIVASDVAPIPVTRDGYSATSVEEISAKRQAEAEAVALAELQSRAEARIKTSAASVSSFALSPPSSDYSGSAVIAYAEQFVGVVPYGMGNDPSDTFSCDGLTQYVLGKFGVSLPRGVNSQDALGTKISPADAQVGDLVVWPNQHIGIYDGAGGVIHSPYPGRSVSHGSTLWGSYYFIRFAG